jgi:hypothetical protein
VPGQCTDPRLQYTSVDDRVCQTARIDAYHRPPGLVEVRDVKPKVLPHTSC